MSWHLLDSPLDILGVAVVLSTFFTIFLVTLPDRYVPKSTRTDGARERSHDDHDHDHVCIVVLGDIGRSPRMQYHALSVAKNGGRVPLVGYVESEPHPDITRLKDSISIVPISPFPKYLQTNSKVLFPILAPLKVIWQVLSLYRTLSYSAPASKWMLVQNPPSIPTLAVAQVVCFLRNTSLVIDWHNFGYSILALKLGSSHPLVRISRWYERFFALGAKHHFTVTKAMARVLKREFGVTALPLHDRPPEHFQPLSAGQRKKFLEKLPETAQLASSILSGTTKLIVSSTSWTPDEDFSLLLDALVSYSSASTGTKLPRILAIITGKGPQKTHYLSRIAALKSAGKLANVDITTAWLSMPDYASLLGSVDIGISLHTSSSGVDLPMKVVDMFGTGLPVFGWGEFEAWPELVTEDVNGKGFGSAEQLAQLLVEYFGVGGEEKLARLREGAMRETRRRWDEEWDAVAGKVLKNR